MMYEVCFLVRLLLPTFAFLRLLLLIMMTIHLLLLLLFRPFLLHLHLSIRFFYFSNLFISLISFVFYAFFFYFSYFLAWPIAIVFALHLLPPFFSFFVFYQRFSCSHFFLFRCLLDRPHSTLRRWRVHMERLWPTRPLLFSLLMMRLKFPKSRRWEIVGTHLFFVSLI